jgi:hypothetical protein
VIDGLFPELAKVAPARAPGVHDGRDSGPEGESVRRKAPVAVAVIRVGLGAPEDVGVHVHQARSHEKAARVDDRGGGARRDIGRDSGDLASGDGNVHHPVDAVLRVDHVTAFDQEIVPLRPRDPGRRGQIEGDIPQQGPQYRGAASDVVVRVHRVPFRKGLS